jgi:16S rRNA (uracil1498-N3)-methyltransferase
LVEKAVELGVGVLQPIEFIRSASVADGARSPAFWSKARRRAEAALEQSGGAWLPELRDPSSLEAFLEDEDESDPATTPTTEVATRLLLTPSADRELVQWLTPWTGRSQLTLLVGPEGGLEPSERDAILASGFRAARLGDRTLRFETAAIAAVAVAGQHVAAQTRVGHAEGNG